MKKIFVALFFAFLFSSVGYVAVSKNIQPQTVERSGCCSHQVVLHIVEKAGILFVMMELKALAVLADKN